MECFNGSVEYMPDQLLESKLSSMQKDIKEMRTEAARRAQFSPAQKLADNLHQRMCRSKDCDYAYGGWNGAGISTQVTERGEYLNRASKLLQLIADYRIPETEVESLITVFAGRK